MRVMFVRMRQRQHLRVGARQPDEREVARRHPVGPKAGRHRHLGQAEPVAVAERGANVRPRIDGAWRGEWHRRIDHRVETLRAKRRRELGDHRSRVSARTRCRPGRARTAGRSAAPCPTNPSAARRRTRGMRASPRSTSARASPPCVRKYRKSAFAVGAGEFAFGGTSPRSLRRRRRRRSRTVARVTVGAHRQHERAGGSQVGDRAVEYRQRLGAHLRARHMRIDEAESCAGERVVAQRGEQRRASTASRARGRPTRRDRRSRRAAARRRRRDARADRACRDTATSESRRCAARARTSASCRRCRRTAPGCDSIRHRRCRARRRPCRTRPTTADPALDPPGVFTPGGSCGLRTWPVSELVPLP